MGLSECDEAAKVAYAPKLPLAPNGPSGYYNVTDLCDLTKQNFRNLLLTNQGERAMLYDFGVGLRSFLFELNTIATQEAIKTKILSQTNKYLPYIEITNIFVKTPDEAGNIPSAILNLVVSIEYIIIPLGQAAKIDIAAGENQAADVVETLDSHASYVEPGTQSFGLPPIDYL